MNKPSLLVDTPYAGPCILEPLPDGASVRLHWDGKLQHDWREPETCEEAILHARAQEYLLAEGWIAYVAGQIQVDPEIQKFFKDID